MNAQRDETSRNRPWPVWTGLYPESRHAFFTWHSDGHAAALQQGDVDSATAGVEVANCERRRLPLSKVLVEAAPRRVWGEHVGGNCRGDAQKPKAKKRKKIKKKRKKRGSKHLHDTGFMQIVACSIQQSADVSEQPTSPSQTWERGERKSVKQSYD